MEMFFHLIPLYCRQKSPARILLRSMRLAFLEYSECLHLLFRVREKEE